jgi:hypothetical protein
LKPNHNQDFDLGFKVYPNPKNLGLGSKTLKTGTGSKIINREVTFFTFPNGIT